MGRLIAGVLSGFLAASLAVMLLMLGAETALGRERVYQPETLEITKTWIAVWFVITWGAAILGGWVCASIAKHRAAPFALAGLIVVMGLLSAIVEQTWERPAPASAAASAQARPFPKPPLLISLANPIFGAIGVLAGAFFLRRRGQTGSKVAPVGAPSA